MTLEKAQTMLDTWLEAEAAVAGGMQSYQMGSQRFTRADLGKISDRVAYWQSQVARLTRTAGGVQSVRGVVPIDC
ncbi:MAG: DUF6148 family protein [Thermodesulfobacteriota bacterium]